MAILYKKKLLKVFFFSFVSIKHSLTKIKYNFLVKVINIYLDANNK